MNRKRLSEIVEAYGADPARWPIEERAAAAALFADLAPAERGRVAAEAALDQMLGAENTPPASAALRARIRSIPFAHRQMAMIAAPSRSGWLGRIEEAVFALGIGRALAPTAALLLVAALAGFTAGWQGTPSPLAADDETLAVLFAAEPSELLPLSEDGS